MMQFLGRKIHAVLQRIAFVFARLVFRVSAPFARLVFQPGGFVGWQADAAPSWQMPPQLPKTGKISSKTELNRDLGSEGTLRF